MGHAVKTADFCMTDIDSSSCVDAKEDDDDDDSAQVPQVRLM